MQIKPHYAYFCEKSNREIYPLTVHYKNDRMKSKLEQHATKMLNDNLSKKEIESHRNKLCFY